MSEFEPTHNTESENTPEFDEAEAWKELSEIARDLFPDLPEEEIAYLAGMGIDVSKVTNSEGQEIADPLTTHTEDLFEALGQLQTLAAQYGIEDELNQRLTEVGIL